ncbi:two-component system response regulator [Bdellovibrio sp. HCB337]|uniref:response regulator n=1 Tax=Bdellovibrio sp. HCB337 TaxID=3394358 RepID=UPI0039A5D496
MTTKEKGLIFIIEDEPAICMYMEELFTGDGFRVISTDNGKTAFELLRNLETLPSIIFLDLMMPVMDGWRFLRELQNNPENERIKDIPVVVITATQSDVSGNVVDVVRKPPDLDRLSELAEKYAAPH